MRITHQFLGYIICDSPSTSTCQPRRLAAAAAAAAAHHALQTVRFYVNETRRSYASFNDVVDEDIWIIYNDKIAFSGRHIHEDVSCNVTS
jgi:hypothetical protein